MSVTKKITTNVNKDAGLLDIPSVSVPTSSWISKHTNYCSMNAGDIYPIYVEEVIPKEKRKITMAMLSHMTTPIAPLLNAMYTEFRAFFVPHRLSADLLAGYSTRKSPFVKVFGEDNSKENAQIVVPLNDQKLPDVTARFGLDFLEGGFKPFGGIADALNLEPESDADLDTKREFVSNLNFLNLAAYELIYQSCYRNQNRESATSSSLYRFLFNAYNRLNVVSYDDSFHQANREKDYFTGAQPFTQKGDVIQFSTGGDIKFENLSNQTLPANDIVTQISNPEAIPAGGKGEVKITMGGSELATKLVSVGSDMSIEQLRLLIKTQEMLEKDMMYGSDYASYLNAHFGVNILKGFLDEPQEIKKTIVTSQMQAVLQTSATSSEPTILGSIGANATTQSGDLEIVPETFFPEYGYLIICAVHKTQNVYDAIYFKPKHIFKKARFDYFVSELEDLGYQTLDGREMKFSVNKRNPVGFNESYAEYRFVYNKAHGMVEPSRQNALDYWTTALSNYDDIQSLYKQSKDEVDRVISVNSSVAPQFFDAYGFVEVNTKPMKLHSIPGMDGVI